MAGLKNYSVLKARAIGRRLGAGTTPHYQILCSDDASLYRVAVNIESQLEPSELEYLVVEGFSHPVLERLAELAPGLHPLRSAPDGAALDYIRGNLFDPEEMVPLPPSVSGPDNDLNEKLDHYVRRAMADEDAMVLAFGEPWGPETNRRDKYFGFEPGRGIHDVHMNQGNVGRFIDDDGVWQDGGLFFHFPGQDRWTAVFLKFQSQAWHTDDETGHRVDAPSTRSYALGGVGAEEGPDRFVRIIAGRVGEGRVLGTVTLLNVANRAIPLDGWRLRDYRKHEQVLSGSLGPGAALSVPLQGLLDLPDRGGVITLVDAAGLKVDGISYTGRQAAGPGWSIVF